MVAIRVLTAIFTYAISLCGIIPLLPWLPLFLRVTLLAALVVGLWHDSRGRWQLKPWMQNVVIVPVFVYYALQFGRANLIQPVISILAIMLAVRLGGEKTVRHSTQIYALSLFCLASSTLFDLSPAFLAYLGFLLLMVPLALVLLTFQNQDAAMTVSTPELKKILISALMLPVLALPLLLIFFPILPRTQFPLWHFLTPPASRSTGFTESVEPGIQSSITISRALVFRAEMEHLVQAQLYWRGTVLNLTDGNKWTRMRRIPSERSAFSGKLVRQTIYPEPTSVRVLIALDRPAVLSRQRITQFTDGVFELNGSTGRRLSYTADSEPDGITAQRAVIDRLFYLQLPKHLPARLKALAADIVRRGKDDRARVELLENHFRSGGYHYSTRDLATGDKALERFIFETKRGHCEFFASSFALLLRAAGVPCRLVGGYFGGEYNEFGGYYIVTDAQAHVWVEVYIEGTGWVRVDPSAFATNAGDVWKAPGSRSLKLRITLFLDSLNYAWNRSVISYDFEQQMNIARNVGSRLQLIDPSKTVRVVVPYVFAGFLCVALFFVIRRSPLLLSREQRILHRFLKTVERTFSLSTDKGRRGLFELAAAADNVLVSDFVAIYAGAIYHDRRLTDDEYRQLQLLLRTIRKLPHLT